MSGPASDILAQLNETIVGLRAEVERLSTLYATEHHTPDPKRAVLYWLEIPNRQTGQPELACAGLMTTRMFPGVKYFSYLPDLRGLPCPIALPRRVEPPSLPQRRSKPPLSQRRTPGFNLDGTPRKKRVARQ